MWTLRDPRRFTGKAAGLPALLLVLGISLIPGAAAHAAPQSPDRPPATAQERSDLRQTVESVYEVLPVSGGVVLKPRKARPGVRTVEVTGDRIAVNGEPVSPGTLRDWLGADAAPVLRLQAVPAAERRQLFGLDAEPATASPETSAAEPETSAAASDNADDTDVAEVPEVPEKPEVPEAPEPPERPERRHNPGSRVNVGGSVHVRQDEVVDEVVAVGGAADVAGDVDNGVTAIAGPARVQGKVGGDVVAVGGSVFLGSHAVVEGDVTSVGGRIEREPGAVIHGSTNEVSLVPFGRHSKFRYGPIWGFWGGVSDVMGSLMTLVLLGLLVSMVLLVARRPLERVDRQLTTQPWQSVATGVAGAIFTFPLLLVVAVLLAITIIGCVLLLLYPFLFLYLGLLVLLGYATAAHRVGRLLEWRFSRSFGGPYAAALLGLLAIQGWFLLGNLLDLLPGPFGIFAFLCWLVGLLAVVSAVVVGFGAVILARFGLAPGYWPRRGAPPSPPVASGAPASVDHLPLSDPLIHPETGEGWEPEERT